MALDGVGTGDTTALEGFTRIEVDPWLWGMMGAATRLESSAGMDVPVLKREVTFRKKKKKERIWVRKPRVTLKTAIYLPVLACLVVLELVSDHAHYDIIQDEPTSIHDLLSFNIERCLSLRLVNIAYHLL